MTIDDVLKLRETTIFNVWFSASGGQIVIFVIITLIMGALLTEMAAMFVNSKATTYTYTEVVGGSNAHVKWNLLAISLGYVPLLLFASYLFASHVNAKGWEENYANPYFESLPVQKVENIDIISIVPTDKPEYFKITYSKKNIDSVTHQSVIGKVYRTLNQNEDIYYSYVYLEDELPKVKEPGTHKLTLYVPKNYSFKT
jgi:hypothetical protein